MSARLPMALVALTIALTLGACPALRRHRPEGKTRAATAATTPMVQLRPAREPPRYVLLRNDARLHRFAHAGTLVGHDPRPPHAHSPGAVSVYRLVADHGAWLELESLPGWAGEDHCHDADPRMVGLALRVFVHRSDVAEASLTPITQHYPDGTSLRLAAGAGLSAPLSFEAPAGEHIRHLQVSDLALNAEIPDASVGTDYAPAPLPVPVSPPTASPPMEVPAGTTLRFGLGARVRVDGARSALVLGTASGQRRVNLASPCLELVALLGSEAPPPEKKAPAASPPRTEEPRGPIASILPGTPLLWPGGRPAGVAIHMAGFDRIALKEPTRTCLARSVPFWRGGPAEGKEATELVVCVPPAAVVDGH